nr:phytanoyl-CoA dioxygenase family protein [Caballeronia sp. AZ7_KS35]
MARPEDFLKNGFAVFPSFYSEAEIDAAQAAIEKCKTDQPIHISIDMLDEPGGRRTSLGYLSPQEIRERHYKINDLFLDLEPVRHLALSNRVVPPLKKMLGDTPVLCNSLYMDKGTTQPPHVDSLYMTPQTPGHLIATWVAMEDAHEDAGQLEYFPGSHLIEQMKFSDGGYHFIADEMDEWKRYITAKVEEAGLVKKTFAAKKGDVFVWHANLLHAGGAINDWARTRKSLVFHFYSKHDCRRMRWDVASMNGAYWLNREHLAIPPRVTDSIAFSEEAYLKRYPDVAQAVKAGVFKTGRAHFEAHGRQEGRLATQD